MQKKLLLILLSSCLVCLTGCRSFNKGMSKIITKKMEGVVTLSGGEYRVYKLTNSSLKEKAFAGEISIEDVNICYQRDLEEQAYYIAYEISNCLSEVENRTGVKITHKPIIYLIRYDNNRQGLEFNLKAERPSEIPFPFFVEAGNESSEAILSNNNFSPFILIHEIVEFSLAIHDGNGIVMMDSGGKWLFFTGRIINYTRWFRDGFANYAAFIGSKEILQCQDIKGNDKPYSSLSKIGRKLFSWHQYSKNDEGYYDAALGLFLLIRGRFGEEAIREIMLEVYERDYLDGKDLINIANEILKTDIRQLVEDFHFPETGLKMTKLTPALILNENIGVKEGLCVTTIEPNSPSETAGFKKKDVIIKINDEPIKSNLDFELVIFELTEQRNVEIVVWREKKGLFTIQLPLTDRM